MENPGYGTADKPQARVTLKERIVKLLKMNSSPREIALGVAIGVFIAILPVYGLHTVMVVAAALLVKRANKIALLLGTNVSTTLTLPFITWAGYETGKFILGGNFPVLGRETFKNFSYKTFLDLYAPLFLGSVVLGLFLSAVFYCLTLFILGLRKKAKLRKGSV